jgi:hypothetical protein
MGMNSLNVIFKKEEWRTTPLSCVEGSRFPMCLKQKNEPLFDKLLKIAS